MSVLSNLEALLSKPMTSLFKKSVGSVFCDFSSNFDVFHPTDFVSPSGLKWPDDFDETPDLGSSHFQLVRDFESGVCLFNHKGTLYPFTQRKILLKQHKVKKAAIQKIFGDRTPFLADSIFFAETGFNYGDIEFMTVDTNRKEFPSFDSYRNIRTTFPLFWFVNEVVTLKELRNKKDFTLEAIQKLEEQRLFSHKKLRDWQFVERDVTPSADKYAEKVELPLCDYHLNNNQVHIWIKIEHFCA